MPDFTQLQTSYFDLIKHTVPGPASISYFFPIILLTVALCTPPSALSRISLCALFLPAIYASQIHACIQMGTADVISNNIALWSLFCLGLRDVRRDFRRVWQVAGTEQKIGRKGGTEKQPRHLADGQQQNGGPSEHTSKPIDEHLQEEAYPSALNERLPWVMTLMVSLRLDGWRTGDPEHDKRQPPPPLSRRRMLVSVMAKTFWGYVFLDLASNYSHADPYFHRRGYNVSVDDPRDVPFLLPHLNGAPYPSLSVPTLAQLLLPRLIRSSVFAAQIWAIVPFLFDCWIPLVLLLNYIGIIPTSFSPHYWSPIFGSFWKTVPQRGLRGLWGVWWHQINRITSAAPGRALAEALGLKDDVDGDSKVEDWKKTVGYMIVVISAFGFSGVMHMGLIPPAPLGTEMTASEMRWRIASFFWLQIPGFAIELATARLASRFLSRRARISMTGRTLTLLWTATWLCITLPVIIPAFREMGYEDISPVPVSVYHGVTGRGWVVWGSER